MKAGALLFLLDGRRIEQVRAELSLDRKRYIHLLSLDDPIQQPFFDAIL